MKGVRNLASLFDRILFVYPGIDYSRPAKPTGLYLCRILLNRSLNHPSESTSIGIGFSPHPNCQLILSFPPI